METLTNLRMGVLAALDCGALDADEIAATLGLDVDDMLALLAELEEAGAILTSTER